MRTIEELEVPLDEDTKKWLGDLKIDLNNLTTEVVEQASHYAWVGTLSAQARKEKTKAKVELQVLEAEIRKELRSKYPAGTRGGPTVEDIKSMVVSDSRYLQCLAELISAEETFDKLEAIREGFRQKSDMIKLLSYQIRDEAQYSGQVK